MQMEQAEHSFAETLKGYIGFWCVAGGWAIDMFINRQTRSHEDLEIVVLRNDYKNLYQHFKKFSPQKIVTGGEEPIFVPWDGEEIEEDVIQLRLNPIDYVEFDLLLTPSIGNNWICRRNEAIQRPLNEVIVRSKTGLPLLAPEIVLLFKAKYVREKDAADFKNVYPKLSNEAKNWFQKNLKIIHPGHIWLD